MNKIWVILVFALALVVSNAPGEVQFAPNATAQNVQEPTQNVKTDETTKDDGEVQSDPVQTDAKSPTVNNETVAETVKEPPTKKYKFYKDIRSIEDLEEGSEEDFDESLENENLKVVYKTPETCKEFTLYLDNKARKLERKEMELKKREKELQLMQERFEKLAENYSSTENRIKVIMQKDPTDLKGNPELSKMVKLFETFSPEEAAARLQNLDLDLTLAILKGVKPKTLSKIMAAMDPKLSAALSSQMVRGF